MVYATKEAYFKEVFEGAKSISDIRIINSDGAIILKYYQFLYRISSLLMNVKIKINGKAAKSNQHP